MSKELQDVFTSLIRLGIGHGTSQFPERIDWKALEDLTGRQGLSAILVDAVEKLPESKRPPKEVLLHWIGEVLQNYEGRYAQYKVAISSLAGFYNQHGFKMMVLKGYACSLDWPNPEHRPCGDIDVWLFGQQKEADAAFLKANTNCTDSTKKFEIDNSHHHHTVFEWKGFTVENHYDFVNVHHSKSNAKIEKIFKELGKDDSHFVEVNDALTGSATKIYLPSPNLHALFLLRHAMIEFAASGINLRQILDWAFFVEKHTKEIDWEWLEGVLEEYGMERLYDVFNAICVGDLGFDVNLFPNVQFLPSIRDRVLNEMLDPVIPNEKPRCLFTRVIWKWHRWKANEWKHQLVYQESMWSSFWSGVWNHMLKPSSI